MSITKMGQCGYVVVFLNWGYRAWINLVWFAKKLIINQVKEHHKICYHGRFGRIRVKGCDILLSGPET